jgi:hypothetical protein
VGLWPVPQQVRRCIRAQEMWTLDSRDMLEWIPRIVVCVFPTEQKRMPGTRKPHDPGT